MRVGAKFVGMVMVVGLGAGVVGLGCAKKKRDAAPATSPVVSAAPSAAPATVSPGPVASPAPVEVEVAKVAGSPSPDQLCAGDCAVPANRMARPVYEASCEATLARVKACSKHAAFKALESRDAIVTLTKDLDYACSEMASDLYHAPIPDDVDAYQELTYSDDLTGEEVGALAAVPEGDCAALAKVAGAIDWPTEHGE